MTTMPLPSFCCSLCRSATLWTAGGRQLKEAISADEWANWSAHANLRPPGFFFFFFLLLLLCPASFPALALAAACTLQTTNILALMCSLLYGWSVSRVAIFLKT